MKGDDDNDAEQKHKNRSLALRHSSKQQNNKQRNHHQRPSPSRLFSLFQLRFEQAIEKEHHHERSL